MGIWEKLKEWAEKESEPEEEIELIQPSEWKLFLKFVNKTEELPIVNTKSKVKIMIISNKDENFDLEIYDITDKVDGKPKFILGKSISLDKDNGKIVDNGDGTKSMIFTKIINLDMETNVAGYHELSFLLKKGGGVSPLTALGALSYFTIGVGFAKWGGGKKYNSIVRIPFLANNKEIEKVKKYGNNSNVQLTSSKEGKIKAFKVITKEIKEKSKIKKKKLNNL